VAKSKEEAKRKKKRDIKDRTVKKMKLTELKGNYYQRRLKKVRASYKQSLSKIEKLQKITARLRKRGFREKNKHNDAEET
jgi:hypothetical protein